MRGWQFTSAHIIYKGKLVYEVKPDVALYWRFPLFSSSVIWMFPPPSYPSYHQTHISSVDTFVSRIPTW